MTSPDHAVDWDGIYRQELARPGGPAGWSIGEPQPALAELIRHGKIRSDVLDAGCGLAELSLHLAAQGYTVVGVDLTASAVTAATAVAAQRGLTTVAFEQADITALSGHDGRFSTIVDSSLLHALPIDRRERYLQSMYRAAAPGAALFILCFADGAFTLPPGPGPKTLAEDELRQVVARHWLVDDITPASIHAHIPDNGQMGGHFDHDDHGRSKIAAWLLSGHKPT